MLTMVHFFKLKRICGAPWEGPTEISDNKNASGHSLKFYDNIVTIIMEVGDAVDK